MHVCSGWCFEMPFCGIYPVLVPQEGWVFLGVWVWGPTCERTIHPITDFSVHRCHVAGLTAYVFRDSSFCACRLRFLFESCWRLLTVNSTRKPFWITILLFLFLLRSPKQVGRNPATWGALVPSPKFHPGASILTFFHLPDGITPPDTRLPCAVSDVQWAHSPDLLNECVLYAQCLAQS